MPERLPNWIRAEKVKRTSPEEFYSNLKAILEEAKAIYPRVASYEDELKSLAYRWKLRAPWAPDLLKECDRDYLFAQESRAKGFPTTVQLMAPLADPFEPSVYPFRLTGPNITPLKLTISAWAFVTRGRKEILSWVAKKLAAYENELRGGQFKEYPSRLERHAQWWFEHYVHSKTFDEIAQIEVYTPDGSMISYAKNVGTAVRKFSDLVGIDPKALK